jgi:CBS domain-containing protein
MDDVAARIDAAASVAELRPAARAIEGAVLEMHRAGMPVAAIAAVVSGHNHRLFAQLWTIVAPPTLVRSSCLLAMGSEGRGEQILRTDQDNALVLADAGQAEPAADAAIAFSAALADFGYPPCPGNIMLTNPLWRQPVEGFRDAIHGWLLGGDAEGPLRLAIFCDAAAVAGDACLLRTLREYLDGLVADNDAYLARFAAAADQFHEPAHWWARLTGHLDEQPLDLKKLGIFPIVHGVRSLALQHRVRALGTAARLAALVDGGHVDGKLADELLAALNLLTRLRLAHQIARRAAGLALDNEVRPSTLAGAERGALRDALAVVKRFRAWLRRHFRFDTL